MLLQTVLSAGGTSAWAKLTVGVKAGDVGGAQQHLCREWCNSFGATSTHWHTCQVLAHHHISAYAVGM